MTSARPEVSAIGTYEVAARCPTCMEVVDEATNADGRQGGPEPGELAICLNCGSALQFLPDLSLAVLPEAEILGLTAEQQRYIRRAQHIARSYRQSHGGTS